MGKTGTRPRIRIGDATGKWKCVIDDDTLTLKDIRLIHRAIDVAVGAARRNRRQRSKQQAIDERTKAAQEAAAEKEAQKSETLELQKAADDAKKAEAEKETK